MGTETINTIQLTFKMAIYKFLIIVLTAIHGLEILAVLAISPFVLIYIILSALVESFIFVVNIKKVFEKNGIDYEHFKSLKKVEKINKSNEFWDRRAKKIDKLNKKAERHEIIMKIIKLENKEYKETV